jgi:hypothetical protein
MVLLLFAQVRAGFEPLSRRRNHGPSLRIEGRSVFLGDIKPTPRLKTGADWRGIGTEPRARRVFRPTIAGFARRVAESPLPLARRLRKLLDRVAQFGCSFIGLIRDRTFQISLH